MGADGIDDDELPDAPPPKPLPGQGSLFGDSTKTSVVHLTHAGQLAGLPAPVTATNVEITHKAKLQLRTPGGAFEDVEDAEEINGVWCWARMGGDRDQYRYTLGRVWDPALPLLAICGLNPSTADGKKNDQTIRKEISFAKLWGYGGFLKVNMYGWRDVDPANLVEARFEIGEDIVGPDNDDAIRSACTGRDVVACWGAHKLTKLLFQLPGPSMPGADNHNYARDTIVRSILDGRATHVYHLGLTKDGGPRHPLYLPLATPRTEWK